MELPPRRETNSHFAYFLKKVPKPCQKHVPKSPENRQKGTHPLSGAHVNNPHDLHGGPDSGSLALSLFRGPFRSGFEAHWHNFCPGGSLMEPKGAQGIQKGSKRVPKASKGDQKGCPRHPKGIEKGFPWSPRVPKASKRDRKRVPKASKKDRKGCPRHPKGSGNSFNKCPIC